MIYIDFVEPGTEEWRNWRERCIDARKAIIEEFNNTGATTVSDLYKDPVIKRAVYANLDGPFSGKCAYCEALTDVNQPGDIEHFRPKNRVTDITGTPALLDSGRPHPGYYWLAYDWDNLVFACIDCNRPSRRKTEGKLIGKRDYFPVRDFRAATPGEEVNEEPLLINPMKENPQEHLGVTEEGVMVAKSDRGQTCIDVFGLNDRESLVKARFDEFRDGRSQFTFALISRLAGGGPNPDAEAVLDAIRRGKRQFAASAREGVAVARQSAHDRVEETAPGE